MLCLITHTTPSGNILEAPELGMRKKMMVPNGVRYRGIALYCTHLESLISGILAVGPTSMFLSPASSATHTFSPVKSVFTGHRNSHSSPRLSHDHILHWSVPFRAGAGLLQSQGCSQSHRPRQLVLPSVPLHTADPSLMTASWRGRGEGGGGAGERGRRWKGLTQSLFC